MGITFEKYRNPEDEFDYANGKIAGSLDPLASGYRRLHAAIVLRAVVDYLQYRKGTQLHDEAYSYFKKVGYLDDAGIQMTGEEIIRYLDRNPDALTKIRNKRKTEEDEEAV